LREALGLRLLSGIPSEDTLSRVVRFLQLTEVEKSVRSAGKEILETLAQKRIRIDGNEMRGTIPGGKAHERSGNKHLDVRGEYQF
jgi:hypothetical protein